MPITSKGKGYPIPDSPGPEGYYCVRVYVPHDQLYMGAFWQSLHYLASPRAWANDADKTALVAAQVWRDAIQKSQEIDACAEGNCGVDDVRQKPDEPCTLQKLDSCTDEWVDFADMMLCKYASPPPVQDNGDDEGNDVLWSWKVIIEQIDTYLDDGKSASEIKILMAGITGMIPNLPAVIDDMAATSQGDRQDAIDDMDWQSMRDNVWCNQECNPADPELFASLQNWIACLINNVQDWAAGVVGPMADWIAGIINETINPPNIIGLANSFPNGGEGFGFDPTVCYFEHTWDAANGWSGWAAGGVDAGELSDGIWYSEYVDLYTQLIVNSGLLSENVTITEVEIHYSTTEHPFGQHRVRYWNGSAWADLFAYPYTTGGHEQTWNGSQSLSRLQFDWESYGSEYQATLAYVRVKGIGRVDPWE